MNIAEPAVKAVVVNCLFTSLAFFFTCLRLYTRAFMVRKIFADDYLVIFSMLASIGYFATFMLQVKAGLGRPINLPEVPGFLQALWATVPLYNLSLTLCKLSITVQCYRVLRTAPRLAKFLRIYLVILVIYGTWAFFSSIFTCWPVDYYWNWMKPIIDGAQKAEQHPERPGTGAPLGTVKEGDKCMNKVALTFSNAAVNIATDFVLLFVPIPLLWKLQIPSMRQKVILVGVFAATGGLSVVMSIVRLWSLYLIGITPEGEEAVHGVMIAIWSCIEINVAVVCACVPALRPLMGRVFPGLAGVSSSYGSRSWSQRQGQGTGTRSRALSGMEVYASRVRAGGGIAELEGHEGWMGTRSNARGGGSDFHLGRSVSVAGHIQVEQSFEMKSVTVAEANRDIKGLYVGDEDEKVSRDGSENNLVRG
ncbi:hypothetical protein V8F20_010225 [Naviculisporaceae sp. PSN 640]